MKMKAILLEDEPLALAQMQRYAAAVPFLDVIGSYPCAEDALPRIAEAEVLFTDIGLPDISGLELVRRLAHPPLVVFTTAYPQYAVEGFRVQAVDYLLKPFTQEDFARAASRVRERFEQRRALGDSGNLLIRTGRRTVFLPFSSIRYVAGMSEYVKVFLLQGESHVFLHRLSRLAEQLPSERFLRIHRSYIVAIRQVREAGRSRVVLDDGTVLPVGEHYREAVEALFL